MVTGALARLPRRDYTNGRQGQPGIRSGAPGQRQDPYEMMKPTLLLAATAALGGCMAAPAPAPVVEPIPVVVDAPAAVAGIAGLQSREPDACHAANYRQYVGQPASVVSTLGITREYRIAEYRGIEPEEYNALRIAFQLDATGNIQSVTCG